MITELLLIIFQNVLSFFVALLPSPSSVPLSISSTLTTFTTFFIQVNSFFPVDTIFIIFNFLIVIEGSILTFKILNWILKKLRGSG